MLNISEVFRKRKSFFLLALFCHHHKRFEIQKKSKRDWIVLTFSSTLSNFTKYDIYHFSETPISWIEHLFRSSIRHLLVVKSIASLVKVWGLHDQIQIVLPEDRCQACTATFLVLIMLWNSPSSKWKTCFLKSGQSWIKLSLLCRELQPQQCIVELMHLSPS